MSSTDSNWRIPLFAFLVIVIPGSSAVLANHCCYKDIHLRQGGNTEVCCSVRSEWNKTTCCRDGSSRNPIHIGVFMPYLNEDRHGLKTAVLMAMDIINNRTDLLPGSDLVVHFGDTFSGSGSKALNALFRWIHISPAKNMLIGPAFSAALQPVALAAVNWNLLQISYAAVSQKFSQFNYRNLYRIVPSSVSFNLAKVAFIKRFQWKRVAIIHMYDAEVFSPSVMALQSQLEKNNISIIAVEGFQFQKGVDISFQFKKLKSLDARVIVAEVSDHGAKIVFCEAYKNKMYGPKFVWIIFGRIEPRVVLNYNLIKKLELSCTREQIKEAMQGMFGVNQLNLRNDNVTTMSGLTSKEFWEELVKRNPRSRQSSSYIFDSVFAAVQTLGKASKTNYPPSNFTYRSRRHRSAYQRFLFETKFEGISGPVRFNTTRDRLGTVFITQLRNESWNVVGQHFTFLDKLELSDAEMLWPDGRVPKDQMIRKEKHLMNDLTLIIVIWLLAIVGTFLSLAFLYFNISYRDNRLIKMSSPQLNNVIIFGCLLCYISIILFGLDARFLAFETFGINCNARTAVMSIGFSLAFGAMFSKTWRVHKIFTAAKTLKKMAIKDIHLFGIVAVLVIVDLMYFSLWFGYDPLKATKLNFTLQETTVNDVIYVPVLLQCTCKYKTYFIAAMYAYKGILLLFGLFLAWETRNVTIPALNDSKYIGMSVYNVVTLSLIGAIVTTALDNTIHYEAPYAISSLCLIICTTATLLLVFVPKVYNFVMASEDNSFNTATINNGVTTTMGRNQSHAFRFESEHDSRPRSYSTKGVQTNHHELTSSAEISNSIDKQKNNINQGFEIHMDDIEIDEDAAIPKTRYNQQLTENGLVTFILTDM